MPAYSRWDLIQRLNGLHEIVTERLKLAACLPRTKGAKWDNVWSWHATWFRQALGRH